MKKTFSIVSALFIMLAFLTGCGNKAPEGYKATDNGLYYHFYVCDEGAELPNVGDIVDLTYSCTINDTNVLIPPVMMLIQLGEPRYTTDFQEGIAMMHIGDSASFIVNIDSTYVHFFRKRMPNQYQHQSTDVMRFDIKINDFYPMSELNNKMRTKAEAELKAYFAKNQIEPLQTETGLYYLKTQDGNGEMPQKGDNVKVHYTGTLMDGTVFDSSIERGEPIEFPLGVGYVIPGWDEGIMMMSKGEMGVLYIPYYLAYGERGAGGVIPPFANLIFEVELVDF